jgi:O-antigen/teichoic acid export membrane protein
MIWRRLLGNAASMTALRIGMAVLGFALFWLLSHRLPAAELGGFSLLMNSFFLLQALPMLGLNYQLTRLVATQPEGLPGHVSNSLAFAFPPAVLMTLALFAYGQWFAAPELRLPSALLGLAMVPTVWTLVAEATLVGREAVRGIAYVNIAEAVVRAVGAWVALEQGWGLTGVFAFFLVGRIGAALCYLGHTGLPRPSLSEVKPGVLRGYLAAAPTYLGITIATAVCARVDVILLARLTTLQDVGTYAAAAKLYEASQMLSTIAVTVVFPLLARLFANDRPAFGLLLSRSLRWGMLLGMPIVLIAMALAPWLVQHVYKPALWGAGPVLQILMLASWLMALDQLLSGTMLAAQAQSQDFKAMSLSVVALVVLLVVLHHFWGIAGAGAAVALALLLRVAVRLIWATRQLPLPGLGGHAWRALLAAVASLMVFAALRDQGTAVATLAAMLMHALAVWLVGGLSADHRREWAQLLHLLNVKRHAA